MIVLGLEGTAHTISCGIVDENRILSNVSSMYVPDHGGIHPREAAVHHAENVASIIKKSLDASGVSPSDIDVIAFSMGPGLGPSLRVTATAARTLSLKLKKPILGVNHPLGHIEIGRRVTGASDPIMLYVSGGNTQVIAHINGRYHVLGETLDIGIGNMLDKFARLSGISFPGGPKIEAMAEKGKDLLDLPYSVKGMDTSFSGILTAAKRYMEIGRDINDICYSIQETAFSMLIEVIERALYVSGKSEILLAGGVALNNRLRKMVSEMADANGVKAYLTDKEYCMDNGAMIAQAAMLMYGSGSRMRISETGINQRYRIDEVPAPWIDDVDGNPYKNRGAESSISESEFYGRKAIVKSRIIKTYRNPELDERIRYERMKNEFYLLRKIRETGVDTPVVYDFDRNSMSLTMQKISGITLKEFLKENVKYDQIMKKIAKSVCLMHGNGITHGDLGVNNIMVSGEKVYMIDPSMGKSDSEVEDLAVDIYMFLQSIKNLSINDDGIAEAFMEEYSKCYRGYGDVKNRMQEIDARHRYV